MAHSKQKEGLLHIESVSIYQLLTFVLRTLSTLLVTVPPWFVLEGVLILCLHLTFVVPFELIRSRWRQRNIWSERHRTTVLQDAAYALVRMGFGYLDYRIGRVFFSTTNSEKLVTQRLGYQKVIRSVRRIGRKGDNLQGWWIGRHADLENLVWKNGSPDEKRTVLLFVHGGGFTLGSPTFYLEFLIRLRDVLAASHPSLHNCAIFAPFYPLAPDKVYPAQILSIEESWSYLAKHPGVDNSRMILLGDSAGGGLCVALMNSIAKGVVDLPKPSQAILMSPWLDLSLDLQQQPSLFENANWDFVEPTSLAHFSSLLLTGVATKRRIGLIRWLRDYTLNLLPFFHSRSFHKYRPVTENAGTFHFPAAQNLPPNGVLVLSGTREILDSQICAGLRPIMDKPGPKVVHWRKENGVHAWPMALYYLGRDSRERGEGISAIVSWVAKSAQSCD